MRNKTCLYVISAGFGFFLGLIVISVVLGLHGCTATPVRTSTAPPVSTPTTTPPAVWKWDSFVASKLTPTMLKADRGDLCPAGAKADVTAFWQALLYATAKAESNLNAKDDYTEKFTDDSGHHQVSSGLLQISLDDRSRGGDCASLSAANIHDEQENLACGIHIMNALLGTRATLRQSLGRYWSTIGKGSVDATMRKLVPGCWP